MNEGQISLQHLNVTIFANITFVNITQMRLDNKILIIGSSGQIGMELVQRLRNIYGTENVIASDIKLTKQAEDGPFEVINVMNPQRLREVIQYYNITQVYLLAALLSATAEKTPNLAWDLNMQGLLTVLNLAKEKIIKEIFWPSSIAVFGSTTPKENTPQFTIMEPTTVYGISKQAGERWCEYYFHKYKVDVRSLRYPGLISWSSKPGGGTTDYAVHIFHEALKFGDYTCFLSENCELPMMYMPDAINATIDIMQAESDKIKIRSSYNLSAFSFSPKELAQEIRKIIPDFQIHYQPDCREQIASSWPKSVDSSHIKRDLGWEPIYNLSSMTEDMFLHLKKKYQRKALQD